MRAGPYCAPREFPVAEVSTPTRGAGEVGLRVELTGVCGTDVHIHEGRFISQFPLTPGHEVVGKVEAVGQGVDLALGTRVVPNGNSGCGTCGECVRGHPLFCLNFIALGASVRSR